MLGQKSADYPSGSSPGYAKLPMGEQSDAHQAPEGRPWLIL